MTEGCIKKALCTKAYVGNNAVGSEVSFPYIECKSLYTQTVKFNGVFT